MPRLLSAYRSHHSTETALLRVLSDLLCTVDDRLVTLLGLFDFSAAFDCVDHNILLRRLNIAFCIDGMALQWIKSFLTEQIHLSSVGSLLCGVPRGSVLGPLFFLLYTAELSDAIAELGSVGHCYADDTQTYISVSADAASAVQQFAICVRRVESRKGSNWLKLNTDKSQVWVFTAAQQSQYFRATVAIFKRPVYEYSVRSWRRDRQPVECVHSRDRCQSFLHVSAASTQGCQAFPIH